MQNTCEVIIFNCAPSAAASVPARGKLQKIKILKRKIFYSRFNLGGIYLERRLFNHGKRRKFCFLYT